VKVMIHNRRIKNKNIGYFLVEKRVFTEISCAEKYCDKKGLDVDEHIQSESKEVLNQVKRIAHDVLPVLYDTREQCSKHFESQLEKAHRLSKEYQEALTKRDLLREYKKEQSIRQLGILDGITIFQNIVTKHIEVHEKIIRM
jgi:hypothetical protein